LQDLVLLEPDQYTEYLWHRIYLTGCEEFIRSLSFPAGLPNLSKIYFIASLHKRRS